MQSFKTFLNESLDKPANWKRVRELKTRITWGWKIGKQNYEMIANTTKLSPDSWDITFTLEDPEDINAFTYKATGTGNELGVFATVIDIILKDLIPNEDPKSITFTAEKEEDDRKTGRSKLYKRLVKRFVPKNYKTDIKEAGHEVEFTITKK